MLFLYREHYYLTRSPEYRNGSPEATEAALAVENVLELIVAKNRKGPTNTVRLFCNIACSHIAPAARGGY